MEELANKVEQVALDDEYSIPAPPSNVEEVNASGDELPDADGVGAFPVLVAALASGTDEQKVQAVVKIRKLLSVGPCGGRAGASTTRRSPWSGTGLCGSERNPPLEEAIAAGAVPHLVAMAAQDASMSAKVGSCPPRSARGALHARSFALTASATPSSKPCGR